LKEYPKLPSCTPAAPPHSLLEREGILSPPEDHSQFTSEEEDERVIYDVIREISAGSFNTMALHV
jgi:hypothetical protein